MRVLAAVLILQIRYKVNYFHSTMYTKRHDLRLYTNSTTRAKYNFNGVRQFQYSYDHRVTFKFISIFHSYIALNLEDIGKAYANKDQQA